MSGKVNPGEDTKMAELKTVSVSEGADGTVTETYVNPKNSGNDVDKKGNTQGAANVTFGDNEKGEQEEPPSCLEEFLDSRPVKLVIFCVLTVYGAVTVFTDWMWARDMIQTEKGLVFGPVDRVVQGLILFITIIGTISYLFELVVNILETFFDKDYIDEDLEQILGLFFQEVPQVTLNMYVSACRETAVSVFQLVKASVGILGSLIRVLTVLIHYCAHKKKKKANWTARIILLIAAMYTFFGSIAVFTFIYTTRPDQGFKFKPPTSLFKGTVDGGRYLYKSGVYFSHPDTSNCNNVTVPWNQNRVNWIQLASIYEIKSGPVNAIYEKTSLSGATLRVTLTGSRQDLCFNISGCNIQELNPCPGAYNPQNQSTIYMKFRQVRQSTALPLGDVVFNARFAIGGACERILRQPSGMLRYHGGDVAQLQYIRAKPGVNDSSEFFREEDGSFRYYMMGRDLLNVTDAWKTGYAECPMSGSLAPNHRRSMRVRCGTQRVHTEL